MMELAIEVMRRSVAERRVDGKASPSVGAVLVKPDGTVETAFRGELREGDHAEFTLLERKNRGSDLGDSVLFATLEPCAPDARKFPKIGCAQRIVLARIKEVYIGIEDPDPTVDRKGIKYLEDHGIVIHMFDRDLQEEIQRVNEKFIEQALERAEAAREEKKSPVVTLSPLEKAVPALAMRDFSVKPLERYRRTTKVGDAVGSGAFARRLVQQGLAQEQAGKLIPTGFGALLFGREPRVVMPQAGLLATIHYPDGSEEPRDFDGPMVTIPKALEEWLRAKLPNTIDRSRMERRDVPPLPFEIVREAVVNALVHRDYDIAGAKCQLVVTGDTVVVRSPGAPLAPVTLEQLNNFTAPMLSRNPPLHYVFSRMDLAEERGLGMKTLREVPRRHGLPLPRYTWEAPYLTLTIYRNAEAEVRDLSSKLSKRLTADDTKVMRYVGSQGSVGSREIGDRFGFDERRVQRILSKLVNGDLLKRSGSGRATRYRVAR